MVFFLLPWTVNFSTKKKTAKQSLTAFLSNRIYWNSSGCLVFFLALKKNTLHLRGYVQNPDVGLVDDNGDWCQ